MSRRHDQKHPLYNRSNFRYRDSPQSPRVVLGVSFADELWRAQLTRIATTEALGCASGLDVAADIA